MADGGRLLGSVQLCKIGLRDGKCQMILSFAAEEHEERSGLWMLVCFSHLSVSFSLSSGFFYLFFLLWVCFLCLSKPGYWLAVCFLSASSRCEAQQLTATGFYHPKVA